jgi:hypothetical protein
MKIKTLILVAIPMVLWSCSGSEKSDNQDSHNGDSASAAETDATPVSDMADFKFHTMIANLPSPLETFKTISDVNLETDGVVLTPIEKAGKLSTTSTKAYGYGMYITDMGFMAYQHHNQEMIQYFQTCRELASSLGAGDVFDQTISANFEENTSDETKFIMMMDEAFNAMDDYMVSNERFVNATEIFVGSWVETQIIATRMVKGKEMNDNNKAIYQGIYEQKMHASNLMNVLAEIETELDAKVVTSVEDIMMFYAGFTDVKNITQKDLTELELKLEKLKAALIS